SEHAESDVSTPCLAAVAGIRSRPAGGRCHHPPRGPGGVDRLGRNARGLSGPRRAKRAYRRAAPGCERKRVSLGDVGSGHRHEETSKSVAAQLSPARLERCLRQDRLRAQSAAARAGPARIMTTEASAPASYVQRAMWVAAQRNRGAALNVMILPWRILGPLELPVLEAALTDLVERHPTLRTRLALSGGQLLQVIGAAEPPALAPMSVEGATVESRLAHAKSILR